MTEPSKKVMVSSTARDLPEHRKMVMDACLRQNMLPKMMEHLPAKDADAIQASLDMVDEADFYLGIFAFRYGYVPKTNNPEQISITEMEYNRAVQRGIPRLIFFMDKTHPITAADMDEDTKDPLEAARRKVKLDELKQRAGQERVANFFTSAENLRGLVINTLSYHRQPDLTAFHYISDIPAPPEVYIAHPYTLLQTRQLIGRQAELTLLTDWVTSRSDRPVAPTEARLLAVIAIGGMGKSALTWNWFNDIAPQEMKPLAGRMWWSFYESDATFENFVTRALAYMTGRPREEVEKISPPDRETRLLAALDRDPFLLVLDGLERILIAYARMDAAQLQDNQVEAGRNLRKTADPRAGRFLRKLAQVKQSRILVSSRLYPADLETEAGDPLPGVFKRDLSGLSDEDAVALWRAFGVSGSRDDLLPLFASFDKHPLLIQVLAGEVKRYRPAPGDLAQWRRANPHFDPTRCPRTQEAMAHVLEFALTGLDDRARRVLHTIAAFRMPARYDTLAALLVEGPHPNPPPEGEGTDGANPLPVATVGRGRVRATPPPPAEDDGEEVRAAPPCADERDLDALLTDLEDRGLLGWDKRANRYDLHPIVRGVVWSGLADDTRQGVYTILYVHFEAVPKIDDWQKVNSLEDLTPAIELYHTLIGLGRYEDACDLFYERLEKATHFRLSASRQRTELLEMLFPDGLEQLPRLSQSSDQAFTLNALALAYKISGQPGRAAPLYRHHNDVQEKENEKENLSIGLGNLSNTLRQAGALREAEAATRRALVITREQGNLTWEATSLDWWGLILAARGQEQESANSLDRSLRLALTSAAYHPYDDQAMRALWFGYYEVAKNWTDKAITYAQKRHYEAGIINALRLQGAAALGLNDFATADERLHHALTRARAVNYVEEELPALVALAELRRRQGDIPAARDLLDDVWESAERGPFPLLHADALNVLAQIERDAGNQAAAVEAASKAYRLAWCDGPPFAYHWGLEAARQHLSALGAPEPAMPPFDESKFEPMPEVEIDPEDEFHVGE